MIGGTSFLNNCRNFIEWQYVKEARLNRARSGNFSQPINNSLRAIKKAGNVLNKANGFLLATDIAMSGEIKPSDMITTGLLGLTTVTGGAGSIFTGIWFFADYGTMGVNYLLGNGAIGLGDMLDNSNFGKSITIKMYDGIY